jgi:hypothetical protein
MRQLGAVSRNTRAFAAIDLPGGYAMHAFYRIQHNGEEIAAADTIDQARAIVGDSRPGSYSIVEVRDTPGTQGHLMTRNWGQMIHPDDGPVVLDPVDASRMEVGS